MRMGLFLDVQPSVGFARLIKVRRAVTSKPSLAALDWVWCTLADEVILPRRR